MFLVVAAVFIFFMLLGNKISKNIKNDALRILVVWATAIILSVLAIVTWLIAYNAIW